MKNTFKHGVGEADRPMNSSRRRFIKNTAAMAALAATGPVLLSRYGEAAAEPINIGVVASLTGYLSDQAQNVVDGVQLAADHINSSGGLLGRPIKVIVRDDEMKPPVGARRFEELVKTQNIVMHSGIVFSPISSAIDQTNKLLGDKGVVLFDVTKSPTEQVPQKMHEREFIAGSSLEAFGLAGAEHASANLGKKTFLMFTDYAWGWNIRDAFLKGAKANGIEIMGTLAIPPSTTDFQPFLTQLMAKGPEFSTCIVNGMMLVNCLKQAYGMGLKDKTKFISFHVNIEEVNACGPEVIKDVALVTDYFWNLDNPKNKQFVEMYMKKYGAAKRPSMRVFLHYATVMMWADAVRQARTVDPKTVAAKLVGFKGDYGKGMMEIRKSGDHTNIQSVIVARGKGPNEMKDKFDTQEIVKIYSGEKYFYTPQEKGWS